MLRHAIEMEVKGAALLSWALVIRPLHDALLEDALATARASLGMAPRMRPWSPWVRILRRVMSGGKPQQQEIPTPEVIEKSLQDVTPANAKAPNQWK
jgi:hypothetical protein